MSYNCEMLVADFDRLSLADLPLKPVPKQQLPPSVTLRDLAKSLSAIVEAPLLDKIEAPLPWAVIEAPQPQELKETSIAAGLRSQAGTKEYDFASV